MPFNTGTRFKSNVYRLLQELDFEVELAIVIGKTAKRVTTDNAMDYVAGCVSLLVNPPYWHTSLSAVINLNRNVTMIRTTDMFQIIKPSQIFTQLHRGARCKRSRLAAQAQRRAMAYGQGNILQNARFLFQ